MQYHKGDSCEYIKTPKGDLEFWSYESIVPGVGACLIAALPKCGTDEDDATVLLRRPEVEQLIRHLQAWLDTGSLELPAG